MILNTLLMAASPVLASTPDVLAIQVGRAETVSDGTIPNAVILVEDGKITVIGEDLPIERGVPVVDLGPDSVAWPGMVNCYSRQGLDSRAGNDSRAGARASDEIYPAPETYHKLLELGITTLGLYPPGNGIPGRAVAVRPTGETKEEMLISDDAYLKVLLRANAASKKMVRSGFEEADKYIEEEKKAREKWEKAKEKADKEKKKKEEDRDPKKMEIGPYTPPEPEPEARAFQQLRDGELKALVSVTDAAGYLHWTDSYGDEEFSWDLRIPTSRNLDIFHVKRDIGSRGVRVVMEPAMTLQPNTRRLRNLPAELAEAGAKLVLVPRSDSLSDQEDWRHDTAGLVWAGLEREVALRAMTLEPAELMGLGERLGSLSAGKDANILFFDGDPFEPGTELEAVMLEGEVVHGEMR